ncbi:MAG: hypothetical protein ACP5HC_09665 [Caldisericum sp.]
MANVPLTYVPYSIPNTMPFYLGITGIVVTGIVGFMIGFLIMRVLVYNRDIIFFQFHFMDSVIIHVTRHGA